MQIARFIFQLFGINTYIVWNESTADAAIIDPGMSSEKECKAILKFIAEHGLTLKHLINTHMHIDHAAADGFISETFKLKLSASPLESELAANLSSQAVMFGLDFKPQSIEITTELNDGDIIPIGNENLRVILVPGHSPGSVALYDSKDKFVISGDALFNGSIGRTDLPGGNYQQLINAIQSKLFTLPDGTIVYPGHGDPTTIGKEKRENPFF